MVTKIRRRPIQLHCGHHAAFGAGKSKAIRNQKFLLFCCMPHFYSQFDAINSFHGHEKRIPQDSHWFVMESHQYVTKKYIVYWIYPHNIYDKICHFLVYSSLIH